MILEKKEFQEKRHFSLGIFAFCKCRLLVKVIERSYYISINCSDRRTTSGIGSVSFQNKFMSNVERKQCIVVEREIRTL